MLTDMQKIISVTDLIRNAARITDDIETNNTVYHVTRGGRGSVVLLNQKYFEGWMHVLDEMRRPDFHEVFAETTADIEAGRGQSWTEIEKELFREHPPHPKSKTATARAPRGRARKGTPKAARARGVSKPR
jgi:PHD/YefM family antitoxin component YafN of YafNO toxin-antitoxin module